MEIVRIIIKAIVFGYGIFFGGCFIYNIFKKEGKK